MEFLSENYKNRIQELSGIKPFLIKEEVKGKHFVVVDVQPEYSDYFGELSFNISNFINNNYENMSQLTFLYNGQDTLGMISENEYINWWIEQGLDENIAYNCNMYDKGYAFFRFCMDEGINENSISNLVKHMIKYNVNDSRDLDEDFWNDFIEEYGDENIRELIEFSDDCITIPELIDEIKNYNNIVLCGGGINQCLKEVEIALKAIDKNYIILNRFTY